MKSAIICFLPSCAMYKDHAVGNVVEETGRDSGYLIVTIICEYKILRFGDSDDFAGIDFCDFTKSS